MEGEIIGAIKIKDGLFIGDEYAAKDLEFAITNKITHVINCAGRELENFWESIGVVYLTFNWMESETQILFDTREEVVNEIYNFIEEAVQMGEGVLVHSVRGQSRSCCAIAAYFMKRFNWTLYKTLEFLNSRRPDLEIRANFFHQLTSLETRLNKTASRPLSTGWNDASKVQDTDELIIQNTFLNAKNAPFDEELMNPNAKLLDLRQRLIWKDYQSHQRSNSAHKPADKKKEKSKTTVRSVLKGSKKLFKFDSGEEIKNEPLKPNPNTKAGLDERPYETTISTRPLSLLAGPGSKFNELNEKARGQTGASGTMVRSSSASNFARDHVNNSLTMEKERATRPSANFSYEPQLANTSTNMPQFVPINFDSNSLRPKSTNEQTQKVEPKQKLTEPSYDSESKENVGAATYSSVGALKNNFMEDTTENPQNSLAYLAKKQLILALEKRNQREGQKTEKKEETELLNGTTKTTNTDLDKLLKKVQPSNNNRDMSSISPMVRRGESPAVRKDDKKEPESIYTKALSKIAESSKPKANTSQTQFNTLTKIFPSNYLNGSFVNNDKKTNQAQINFKPSYQNYLSDTSAKENKPNLNSTLTGGKDADQYNTNGSNDQSSSKLNGFTPHSASNGFTIGQRGAPIKAKYEILDRPHTATNTKQTTALDQTSKGKTLSSYQIRPNSATQQPRSYSPTIKSSKHTRKESPLGGQSNNARERNSSPAQIISFNNLYLGQTRPKPRWK